MLLRRLFGHPSLRLCRDHNFVPCTTPEMHPVSLPGMRDAPYCLQIWDAQTSLLVSSCRGHQHDVSCLTVNCTDAILASGSYDCFIRTWGLEVSLKPVCCDVRT